ncbi:stem 28 kDa glycoprotein-like [Senna tora]|uniref:Stem 28 kDa glycoprotein-like n=1 Tax=Senna tora TaxID=362788 RepID=A0A834XD56_9FABA|nr:stem 28 kDa glycoprotein-like [Senna tora]
MKSLLLTLLLVASAVATSHGTSRSEPYLIHPLRLKSGSGSNGASLIKGINCASWRLGVEAHNIIDWKTVPQECEEYVGNYMLGLQYRQDSQAVTREAYLYAKSLNLSRDGKDIWVFDIDETSLSNLPYYAKHGFGAVPYNATSFNEWVEVGVAPALPESKKLYKKLLSLGINVVFLTGRPLSQKHITASNLNLAGYHTWTKLIVKDVSFTDKTAVEYKSAERRKLEKSGYRIVGNIGDQWSDILGTNTGHRTFKLPDPLYYIS